MFRFLVLFFAALICCWTWSAPAFADDPETFSVDDLSKIERERNKALKRLEKLEKSGRKADRELNEIDSDLIKAAADSRRHEVAALAAETRLELLSEEESTAKAKLLEDEEALEDVLAVLMTFGARRPPALAVSPDDAGGAVRAAILMGDVTPKLAARAETLATEIQRIAELQATIRQEREDLLRTEKALTARREQIKALFAEKQRKRAQLAAEAARVKTETEYLATEADNLKDLLAAISNAAPRRPSLKPPAPQTRKVKAIPPKDKALPRATSPYSGRTLRPVTGDLILAFQHPDESGLPHKGQTWRTRSGAQVIAPRDAHIKFSGNFRSYGQILILDVGGGYLVVLAGLGDLYSQTGQSVLAGEPIGRMSEGANLSPELYIEVRRDGELVDPARWLDLSA